MKRNITTIISAGCLACLLALAQLSRGDTGQGIVPAVTAQEPGAEQAESSRLRRQNRRCSLRSAQGVYGFALAGSVFGIGPISTSGTTEFDGEGKDTGAFVVTTNDSVQRFTFTGVYTVNRDCTGTATLNITPPIFNRSVLHFAAVGVDNEREIKWLITDPGVILAGTLTKQ
jgi:hypothetical protein